MTGHKHSNRKAFERAMLAHGGAGSRSDYSDGPESAIRVGMEAMATGQSALSAAVSAVRILEDDPRFNAGVGSQRRADGHTKQMDAACMSGDGQFGAVACVTDVPHPIDIAQAVLLHSPHILIAGDGARIFARQHNLIPPEINRHDGIESETAPHSCDTVGAVAFDGTNFAVALSTGGLANAAIGRVGDVPMPGCGLFCGPLGAIACTGDGEDIALKILAREVYGWLEKDLSPVDAAQKALSLFDESVDIGLIILSKTGYAGLSRNGMAWSYQVVEH